MNSVRKTWGYIVGMWSLLVGLKVTGGYFFRNQVTVHYPRQTVDNLDSFRGPIQLMPKSDDPAKPKCIACMTCVAACPDGCISVTKQKKSKANPVEAESEKGGGDEGGRKKSSKAPSTFSYDYTLCSLCGLCVENCPVHALRFSNRAYLAGLDRNEFVFDLLARFNPQSE